MQRVCTGALFCLFSSGCPVPETPIPDFTPVATTDGGQTAAADGGAGSWSTEKQTVSTQNLHGVWVLDAALSRAFIVGVGGTILSQSGGSGSWTAETSGTTAPINAVVGLSSDEAFAGGGATGQGLLLHRKNGVWKSEATTLDLQAIYGIAVVGGDVFAVGDTGTIVHWTAPVAPATAGTWTLEMPPKMNGELQMANLHAVYGSSPSDVYAVGEQGTIFHRDGTGTWSVDGATFNPPMTGNYYGLAALGSSIFMVGTYGMVLRRDPGTPGSWNVDLTMPVIPQDMGGLTPPDLLGITAAGSELVAVGQGGLVLHRAADQTWTLEQATTSDLYSVSGVGSHAILAVGAGGAVVRRN